MSEIWKPQSNLIYSTWIDMIIGEASDRLTDWEIIFIHSMQTRIRLGQDISQLMAEKLEQIYVTYTN